MTQIFKILWRAPGLAKLIEKLEKLIDTITVWLLIDTKPWFAMLCI